MNIDVIINAVCKGDLKRLFEILLEDPTAVDLVHPSDGCTPLMYASAFGLPEVQDFLLDKGAIIDRCEASQNWTALSFAVYYG